MISEMPRHRTSRGHEQNAATQVPGRDQTGLGVNVDFLLHATNAKVGAPETLADNAGSGCVSFSTPKSRIFMRPSRVTKMFCGLRS